MIFGEYLTRGVRAGVIAGLVFGLSVVVVADPFVGYADNLNHMTVEESGHTHEAESAHGREAERVHSYESGDSHVNESGDHHDTAVSVVVTEAVNVAAGDLWGTMLGGVLFGAALFSLEPAIPGPDAAKNYLTGFAGFATASGAPWLVLPLVVSGAEQPLSTVTRLLPYAGTTLIGVSTCLPVGYVYTHLHGPWGLGTAFVGAAAPFGLFAVPAVIVPESVVREVLSSALEAGPTGLFAFGQVLLWLVSTVVHAWFRPSSESEPEPGIPTAGRDSIPAAD